MSATMYMPELLDNMAADLSDRAFRVASRHGVRGSSVELEIRMWEALRTELKRSRQCPGLAEDTSAPTRRDACVAALTDRAYRVALDQGFAGDFVGLELDLWSSFQNPAGRTGRERMPH